MMTRTIIAAAFAVAGATPASAQPAVNVGAGQSGQTIRLMRGQELNVAVTACVGCPYRWTVISPRPLSQGQMTMVGPNDNRPAGAEPIIGGSRTETYHFRAARAGRGLLRLNYASFVRGNGTRGNQSVSFNIVVR